jgi:hypothetical protein
VDAVENMEKARDIGVSAFADFLWPWLHRELTGII